MTIASGMVDPGEPRGPRRTFVFTDIERSMQAWEVAPSAMLAVLDEQHGILVSAVKAHGGTLFGDGGDGWSIVFDSALEAVLACVEAQQRIDRLRPGPAGRVRVRMGIHTGRPMFSRGGQMRGQVLNLVGRLHKAAHGGQIVMSEQTFQQVDGVLPPEVRASSLGTYTLRDVPAGEYYQVFAPDLQRKFPPLHGAVSSEGRISEPAGRLIGRSAELEELRGRADPGVLTLTGIGGVGKTRLAVALVSEIVDLYPDGLRVCDLSRASRDDNVVAVVAGVLGVEPTAGANPIARIADSLAPKRSILLLDNCEHVREAVAKLVRAIEERAVNVLVVVTSRVPLGLPEEREWPIPTLSVETGAEALVSDAVELFIARATEAVPRWQPDQADLDALDRICHRLDGLPLAIELAASQIRYLTTSELQNQLSGGLAWLDRSRPVPMRRSTLNAVVGWSYEQLDEVDQAILRQVSVFAGGFTVEAAEGVVELPAGMSSLRSGLARLVDRSLVVVEQSDGQSRYRLLGTVRLFCLERAGEHADHAHLVDRHGAYFLDVAERIRRDVRSEDEAKAVVEADAEFGNFRAAFENAIAGDKPQAAARLVCALSDFCFVRLRYELFEWAMRTLEAYPTETGRSPDLCGIGATGAFLRGDLAEAERLAQLGLSLETYENQSFHVRFMLTVVAGYSGRSDEGAKWVAETLRWCSENRSLYYRSVALVASAIGLILQGETKLASLAVDGALAEAKRLGNPTCLSWAIYAQAEMLRDADPSAARESLAVSLEIARRAQGEFIIGFAQGAQTSIFRRSGLLGPAASGLLDLLDHWGRAGHYPQLWHTLREAQLLLATAHPDEAATIEGALERRSVIPPTDEERAEIAATHDAIGRAIGPSHHTERAAWGAAMSQPELIGFTRTALRNVLSDHHGA